MADLDALFSIIKHNCSCFGGDKETYRLAMKARAAVKFGSADLARRHGFAFAQHVQGLADATGTLIEFAAIVEHAHRKLPA